MSVQTDNNSALSIHEKIAMVKDKQDTASQKSLPSRKQRRQTSQSRPVIFDELIKKQQTRLNHQRPTPHDEEVILGDDTVTIKKDDIGRNHKDHPRHVDAPAPKTHDDRNINDEDSNTQQESDHIWHSVNEASSTYTYDTNDDNDGYYDDEDYIDNSITDYDISMMKADAVMKAFHNFMTANSVVLVILSAISIGLFIIFDKSNTDVIVGTIHVNTVVLMLLTIAVVLTLQVFASSIIMARKKKKINQLYSMTGRHSVDP